MLTLHNIWLQIKAVTYARQSKAIKKHYVGSAILADVGAINRMIKIYMNCK